MGELWSASTVIFRLPFQPFCSTKRTICGAVVTHRANHSPSERQRLPPLQMRSPGLGWPLSLHWVDSCSTQHGRDRTHVIELVGRGGQRIAVEDDQIGQLAWSNRALPVLATGDEAAAEGIGAQRLLGGKGLGLYAQIAAGRLQVIVGVAQPGTTVAPSRSSTRVDGPARSRISVSPTATNRPSRMAAAVAPRLASSTV